MRLIYSVSFSGLEYCQNGVGCGFWRHWRSQAQGAQRELTHATILDMSTLQVSVTVHHQSEYFSYRDPGLQGTLDTFDRAPDWAFDAIADDHLRESAILGVIGAMDKPGSPAGEAIGAFHGRLYGRDGDFLRNLRQQVLGVTAEDIRGAIERYLHPSAGRTAVVLGARALADWDRRDDVKVKELGPTE